MKNFLNNMKFVSGRLHMGKIAMPDGWYKMGFSGGEVGINDRMLEVFIASQLVTSGRCTMDQLCDPNYKIPQKDLMEVGNEIKVGLTSDNAKQWFTDQIYRAGKILRDYNQKNEITKSIGNDNPVKELSDPKYQLVCSISNELAQMYDKYADKEYANEAMWKAEYPDEFYPGKDAATGAMPFEERKFFTQPYAPASVLYTKTAAIEDTLHRLLDPSNPNVIKSTSPENVSKLFQDIVRLRYVSGRNKAFFAEGGVITAENEDEVAMGFMSDLVNDVVTNDDPDFLSPGAGEELAETMQNAPEENVSVDVFYAQQKLMYGIQRYFHGDYAISTADQPQGTIKAIGGSHYKLPSAADFRKIFGKTVNPKDIEAFDMDGNELPLYDALHSSEKPVVIHDKQKNKTTCIFMEPEKEMKVIATDHSISDNSREAEIGIAAIGNAKMKRAENPQISNADFRRQIAEMLKQTKKNLDNHDPFWMPSSQNFKTMQEQLDLAIQAAERPKRAGESDVDYMNSLMDKVHAVRESSITYLEHKREEPNPSSRATSRMQCAEGLQYVCQNVLECYGKRNGPVYEDICKAYSEVVRGGSVKYNMNVLKMTADINHMQQELKKNPNYKPSSREKNAHYAALHIRKELSVKKDHYDLEDLNDKLDMTEERTAIISGVSTYERKIGSMAQKVMRVIKDTSEQLGAKYNGNPLKFKPVSSKVALGKGLNAKEVLDGQLLNMYINEDCLKNEVSINERNYRVGAFTENEREVMKGLLAAGEVTNEQIKEFEKPVKAYAKAWQEYVKDRRALEQKYGEIEGSDNAEAKEKLQALNDKLDLKTKEFRNDDRFKQFRATFAEHAARFLNKEQPNANLQSSVKEQSPAQMAGPKA